jgi:hypothetical protein
VAASWFRVWRERKKLTSRPVQFGRLSKVFVSKLENYSGQEKPVIPTGAKRNERSGGTLCFARSFQHSKLQLFTAQSCHGINCQGS